MLKENVLALVNADNGCYNPVNTLKEHYSGLEIHSNINQLIISIEQKLSICSYIESCLFIILVEDQFANDVLVYLQGKISPSNYIFVVLCSGKTHKISNFSNIYDLVDVTSNTFHQDFFLTKLNNEIAHKNKISLLQTEVKEFYEIGKSLSSEKDAMTLLEMIINSSISMTSSDAGTIYLVIDKGTGTWSPIRNNDYTNKFLQFAIAKNTSMDVKLEDSISPITAKSIFGYAIITGEPVRIDDAYNLNSNLEYYHDHRYDSITGYITKSILSIPMKDHENNILGVIQLINKRKSKDGKLDYTDKSSLESIIPYDSTDELIMNSIAGQAAVALENNLLYRDMQNLLQDYKHQNNQLEFLTRKTLMAHEEERKRIAREIHDGPAQSVVNLSLKLELLKKLLQYESYERLFSELDNLNCNVRSTAKEIRSIIYNLKPSFLEDGLIQALENHVNAFMENTQINTSFNSSGDDSKIEYYLTSTLYRIVQEALTNIFKHAAAANVTVDLALESKNIKITIIDDGKGFDTSILTQKNGHKLESGFGLEGIMERTELIRGSAEIISAPGKGTIIKIDIPLAESI